VISKEEELEEKLEKYPLKVEGAEFIHSVKIIVIQLIIQIDEVER
jgi:hypothetical protein